MDGTMDGLKNRWIDGCIDGQMKGLIDGCTCIWLDEWKDTWIDE